MVLPKRIPNPAQMTSTCQSELEVTPNPVLHFRPCIASVESPARKVRQVNIILRPLFTLRGPNNTTLNHNRCLPSCVRNQMASLKRKRNDLEESEDEGPSFGKQTLPVADLPDDFDRPPVNGMEYLFTVRCVSLVNLMPDTGFRLMLSQTRRARSA